MDEEKHISATGVWGHELTGHHVFDYRLAQWIGQFLPKQMAVIDFGCGLGSYLRYLSDIGFNSVLGIEGIKLTNFEVGNIEVHDLAEPLDLRKFANVICLEVGEHIPADKAQIFIENITRPLQKGSQIILSWAIPGQDGLGHVNCQHNIWVINEMEKRGLKCLYGKSLEARAVVTDYASWFRNTILIFEKQ